MITNITKRIAFTNDVASIVFYTCEDGTVLYHPELLDFAIRMRIVELCYPDDALPEDVNDAYEFLYTGAGADMYNAAMNGNDAEELRHLCDDTVESVHFRARAAERQKPYDAIINEIADLVHKLAGELNNLDLEDFIKSLDNKDLVDKIENLAKESQEKKQPDAE